MGLVLAVYARTHRGAEPQGLMLKLRLWSPLRKKALPPGSTAFFVNGLSCTVTYTIKTFADEVCEKSFIVYACIARIAEACSSVKLEGPQA
jgi:hypothetical protein